MFMKQKKKKICDDTFLFILLFAMHALSLAIIISTQGGKVGKEKGGEKKGNRRNTCRERDPMRVNRYVWSLP